jgi:hypothetical protein
VKIQSKTIRKRYGRGKSEYHYTQYLLPFPVKRNETIKPFLNKHLKLEMNAKEDALNIALTKQNQKAGGNLHEDH